MLDAKLKLDRPGFVIGFLFDVDGEQSRGLLEMDCTNEVE